MIFFPGGTTMIRKFSLFTCCLFLACASLLVTAAAAAPDHAGMAFLAKVEAAVASGELSAEQGLLYKFYYGFDQDKLPPDYRPDTFVPLKNATMFIREFEQMRDRLSPATVASITGYLERAAAPSGDKATYISPSGFFRLTYSTTGGDAVPSTDVDPANGIPDYVEKIAGYCDYSVDVECYTLGFTTPAHSPYYEIDFESMGYYGYTSAIGTYGSSITLHNTYVGFPPNEDPEGNVWGAAKATVAHEFKHASQRAGSRWTEGGWVELDATWVEDVVYDVVNDYYNYLPSGSPISHPATSLDSGGSGSYEDCVYETWMSETWGNQIIVDLWDWRITHTSQAMLSSYDQILSDNGSSVTGGWPTFCAWNYATGTRALAGLGYGEAADYPTAGLVATLTSYPTVRTGSVASLAANHFRGRLFSGAAGTVDVVFDGANGTSLSLTAVIEKTNGTGVIEYIVLDGNNDADTQLSVPRDEILEVGFCIGNGAISGGSASYTLTVDQTDVTTTPQITLDPISFDKTMDIDQTDTEVLQVTNTGEAGSTLVYEVAVQAAAPKASGSDKSIAGSTMTTLTSEYIPGTTVALEFTVYNASTDDEWLTDATLDFPTGITVNSSTAFIGGTYGNMTSDGSTGDGALVSWHGDTGSPDYYGVIVGGESAQATVNVTFGGGLSGTQNIAYSISGDEWGGTPHTVSGNVSLTSAGPTITVTDPNGGEALAIGDSFNITWSSAGGLTDVKIDLSRNNGGAWESVIASTPNDGAHNWTVTSPPAADCLIRVSSLDDSVSDVSDAVFSIYQPVDWLSVLPTGGTLGQGENDVLTLSFDTSGMAEGDYTAYLVFTHNAPGGPDVVPVTLHVNDPSSPVDDVAHAFRLRGNYPNPFNPATRIVFTLPQAGSAKVDVLDMKGRLLRTVWSGDLAAGLHSFKWDGRDDAGHAVAAGSYLGRLTTAERSATCKMMLAK